MQFINFPPAKTGTKVQENVPSPLPRDAAPGNNAVTDKSDLIVPGTQPKLAGRSWPALKESKSFDTQRLNESPLFKEIGRLF